MMNLFATLYCDEDVNPLIAKLLLAQGFSALTTVNQRMLQKSGREQLTYANAIGCCILTHNRVDFENLHTQFVVAGQTHAGILIATRRTPYELAARIARLLNRLTGEEIQNQLLYI